MKTIKFIAHEFRMGDVDDPDLYAAVPLIEWEKSEPGQWLMENKPLIVKLQNITANRIEMIDVNEFGWVDFANDENIIILSFFDGAWQMGI